MARRVRGERGGDLQGAGGLLEGERCIGTTQAVILARGLGTRMRAGDAALTPSQRAAADAGLKGMMPLGPQGRPLLEYVLSSIAEAGLERVTLVVAPEHEAIRRHFSDVAPPRILDVGYAVQKEPLGTADALLSACDSTEDEPFLMMNADNLYGVDEIEELADYASDAVVAYDADALVRKSGIDNERLLRFALLDIQEAGPVDGSPELTHWELPYLRGIVEKPRPEHPLALAKRRWVSMNLWSFTSQIFEACKMVRPSQRGELELQEAVRIGMERFEMHFEVIQSRGRVLDLSSRGDVAFVEKALEGVTPSY